MRFAKVLRFGRTRTDVGVDLWNLFNTNYATGYEDTFDGRRATATRGTAGVHLPAAVRAPELHGELLKGLTAGLKTRLYVVVDRSASTISRAAERSSWSRTGRPSAPASFHPLANSGSESLPTPGHC